MYKGRWFDLKTKNIIHCISINSFPEALWQPMRRLQLWKWDMIPRIIKEFRSLKILWILSLTSFPWQRIHKVQEKFENINKFAESRNIRKGREKWWKSARVHIWRENRNKGIWYRQLKLLLLVVLTILHLNRNQNEHTLLSLTCTGSCWCYCGWRTSRWSSSGRFSSRSSTETWDSRKSQILSFNVS